MSDNARQIYHDDVTKWEHFPRYWSFMDYCGGFTSTWLIETVIPSSKIRVTDLCEGNSLVTGENHFMNKLFWCLSTPLTNLYIYIFKNNIYILWWLSLARLTSFIISIVTSPTVIPHTNVLFLTTAWLQSSWRYRIRVLMLTGRFFRWKHAHFDCNLAHGQSNRLGT